MQFIEEKKHLTFLSVQELQGVQDDHLPSMQLIGTGLSTALALLVPPLGPPRNIHYHLSSSSNTHGVWNILNHHYQGVVVKQGILHLLPSAVHGLPDAVTLGLKLVNR